MTRIFHIQTLRFARRHDDTQFLIRRLARFGEFCRRPQIVTSKSKEELRLTSYTLRPLFGLRITDSGQSTFLGRRKMTEVEEPHDIPAKTGCLQAAAHYWQTFREHVGWKWTQIADVLRKALPKLNENDNAFTAALEAVPTEDWCRTWAAGRTIMLRIYHS